MDLLAISKNLAHRVELEAAAVKVPVTVCIVDVHGNVVLKHRMTGAPVISVEISERKAYTSALVGMRTADLALLVQPGQPLFPLIMVSQGNFVRSVGECHLLTRATSSPASVSAEAQPNRISLSLKRG